MISTSLLDYIVEFLLGEVYYEHEQGLRKPYTLVRYTDQPSEMLDADVVIKPSGFFKSKVYGTAQAEPQLPLAEWEGIPLLFGEPRHEWINEGRTLLLHADLIASTYYLISRYEEMYNRRRRDEHGRFPLELSLPYRAGFLDRPIVDEYAMALRRLVLAQGLLDEQGLSLSPRVEGFSRINLGLDVRKPFRYTGLKASIYRLLHKADPYNTFEYIFEQHRLLRERYPEGLVRTLIFLKVASRNQLDQPHYCLEGWAMQQILDEADSIGAKFALLCSYASSTRPSLIVDEAKELRHRLRRRYLRQHKLKPCAKWEQQHHLEQLHCLRELDINASRHTLSALGEPEDIREMLAAGIRHDYTMAYPTALGFRLGTCRPVRFINPNTRSLTQLVMHPICISDTAVQALYERLRDEEACYTELRRITEAVHRYGGELNISWSNEHYNPELSPTLTHLYIRLLHQLSSDL